MRNFETASIEPFSNFPLHGPMPSESLLVQGRTHYFLKFTFLKHRGGTKSRLSKLKQAEVSVLTCARYSNMASDWKSRASTKQQSILNSIPEKWRISKVPSTEEQKDVTGAYAQQFFSSQELQITETDAFGIAEKVAAGEWSAVEVTEAFCHRASVAHQLVRVINSQIIQLIDIAQLSARSVL